MNIRMTKRTGLILGAAAVLTIGGATTAIASSDDDASDQSITGTALQKAKDAALAETGGGKVTGTEVDDEESKYEVEVTLEDGSQVDVQLDKAFDVVDTEAEDTSDDSSENEGQ
jgi:uncharacterized membrane protein YkoI